jgi:choline dehydrogenase-like flavoprotein
MDANANAETVRSNDEIVDVLIVGAGASGAAVAWSLAETRMKILCLEQGDWVRSTEFPSNGRDWEARRYADFDISPNRRARDTDYPVNDDNSLMKIANFNGVGGGTILFTAHYPRMRGGRLAHRLLDARTVLRRERPHHRRRRPRGRSGISAASAEYAAGAAGEDWHALCAGDERTRLALVAIRHRRGHDGI